jgi:hypothetical protein
LDRTIKDNFGPAKTEADKATPKKIEEPAPDLFADFIVDTKLIVKLTFSLLP